MSAAAGVAEVRQRRRAPQGGEASGRAPDRAGPAPSRGSGKSALVAYLLWLVGGVFGLHHLYLGRDAAAFLYAVSFGGFSLAWLRDVYRITTYVQDANNDSEFVEHLKVKLRHGWVTVRSGAVYLLGTCFRTIATNVLPQYDGEKVPYSSEVSAVLAAAAVTATAYLIGNISPQKCSWKGLALGAAIGEALIYIQQAAKEEGLEDEDSADNTRAYAMFVVCGFYIYGTSYASIPERSARRKRHKGLCRRLAVLSCGLLLFGGMCTSAVYFNATFDIDGETVRAKDSIDNIINSPVWAQLREALLQQVVMPLWKTFQAEGLAAAWLQLKEMLDISGENRAYDVLGLTESATQQEIKKAHRAKVLLYHPDKCDLPAKECEEKFMEAQKAYETLSEIHQKRANKQAHQERNKGRARRGRKPRRRKAN